MNYQYTYTLSQFPNQKVNLDSLTAEIQASSITAVLDYISETDPNVDIFFQTALSAPEIVTLNGIVATHQGIADPGPVVVNDLSIDGSLAGTDGVFTGDYRIEGKLWVETIRRVKQEAKLAILNIDQDTSLGPAQIAGLEMDNISAVGDKYLFGVNRDGILVAGWDDPSISLKPVTTVYGSEFQLAESSGSSTSSATTPQTKVTLTTADLPAGTYRIFASWTWSHSVATSDMRADITLNGTPLGTRSTVQIEVSDTTTIRSDSRVFYSNLSGVNTILLRYWNEAGSTTISDATIELIRVS